MNGGFASKLVTGKLVHRRHRPVLHRFVYPVSYFLVDLDELTEMDRRLPLFGYNRRAAVSFRDADHLCGRPDIKAEVKRFHEERGAAPPEGRILLLTQPRIFGYVFNPVSFYYCHDREGRVTSVLAEVNNTFGERHTYLLDERTRRDRFHETPKEIFVSPFAERQGRFRFFLSPVSRGLSVHMDDFDASGRFLDATLSGRVTALSGASLAMNLVRYPFMTLSIIARIHLQALALWLRRTPHFAHEAVSGAPGPGLARHESVAGKEHR